MTRSTLICCIHADHGVYETTLLLKQKRVDGVAIVDIKSKNVYGFKAGTLDDPVTQNWLNEALSTHASPGATMHTACVEPVTVEENMPFATNEGAIDLEAIQVQDSSPTPAKNLTVKVEDTPSKNIAQHVVTTPPQRSKARRNNHKTSTPIATLFINYNISVCV